MRCSGSQPTGLHPQGGSPYDLFGVSPDDSEVAIKTFYNLFNT